jgi:hypothetical protein
LGLEDGREGDLASLLLSTINSLQHMKRKMEMGEEIAAGIIIVSVINSLLLRRIK